MTLRRLLIVGIAIFVAGIVMRFPARVAYQWFAPDSISVSGIRGTVWNGSATEANLAGVYASNLSWSFRPLALFTGRLAYDVTVNPAGGYLESVAAVGFGGDLMLSDAQGGVTLSALRPYLPLGGVDGSVRVELSRFVLDDGLPAAAEGWVELLGLQVHDLAPQPLGNFRTDLSGDDGNISGTLQSLEGALDVTGSFSLDENRNYLLEGTVAPTGEAPASVVRQLEYLGSADAAGRRPFRFEGRL